MTGAQSGDFDSPPASSPTDRRDADDAISLERLIRRIRLDNPAIPRDLGPAAGMWAQSVTEVQVTYHREPGHEGGDWLTDEVTLVGSDGAVMQREVDTLQRGHRTEGVFATLRWRRKPRLSRWDLGLETLPAWLDELVEEYRPPGRSAVIAALNPAPGTDGRPTFEAALAAPGAQFDTKGEVLPHLLAFGPPPELRMVPCHCAAVHIGPCNLPVRTSVQVTPAPGTECRHVGKRGLDCDCDEPASGTDSSGQAVQRVLALADEFDKRAMYGGALVWSRIRAAVAGPQHDGRQGQ